jgi:DNA-binding response OmpR family regulator/uncharacterized membrane protein (UPF0127 family)
VGPAPQPPRRLRGLPSTIAAGRRVRVAERPLARLLGLALLARERAGPGLLIPRCGSVHTFGMRFPIDIVFLDRDGRELSRRTSVPAGRMVLERRAAAVLELPSPWSEPAPSGRASGRAERARVGGENSPRAAYPAMLPESEPLATVVVCEDDEPTLELLCDHLTADRYRPLAAPCASDALRLCQYNDPDLLLLDLRLPDASGLDVLREIRATDGSNGRFDPSLPVVVLSGRGTPADRVRGLAEGADDYLVKPFHVEELVARVRAVLRRRSRRREGPRRVGDLHLDPVTREVRVAGRRVELANKEFVLLRTLASDPTRVFSKQELLRDVWGFKSLGRTRTLDSHASRLRRKLDPEGTRFIVNVWGVGYRLVEP